MQMFSIWHLGILLAIMGAIRDYTTKFQEIRLITFYLKMFYKQQCRAWKKNPRNLGFILDAYWSLDQCRALNLIVKKRSQIHSVIFELIYKLSQQCEEIFEETFQYQVHGQLS